MRPRGPAGARRGRAAQTQRGPARGFSLIEVLVALALATLVLGVLLSTASSQTLRIARMDTRYQALLTASSTLMKAADQKFTGQESSEDGDYKYTVRVAPVPADPRVDQLRVEVEAPRGIRVSLQAYRLRSQHLDPATQEGEK